MIELEFIQFHEQQYPENGYELYVLKNGLGDILYVGISTNAALPPALLLIRLIDLM